MPTSSRLPSREIPSPYITSNSTVLNGGATLFLTTLTLVWLPTASLPTLSAPMRLMSRPHAGVELERPPSRRRLRRAEHDPDLLPQLVDEDGRRPRARERTRELPQSLAHEPGLKSHVRVAHLPLDLSPRYECGDRVYYDDIEGAGADEGVGYLQGLFAVIRLGKVEVLQVHADSLGVSRVEGVLGVDEGGEAPGLLRLGDDVQGEGRLAARLRDRRSRRRDPSGLRQRPRRGRGPVRR